MIIFVIGGRVEPTRKRRVRSVTSHGEASCVRKFSAHNTKYFNSEVHMTIHLFKIVVNHMHLSTL